MFAFTLETVNLTDNVSSVRWIIHSDPLGSFAWIRGYHG